MEMRTKDFNHQHQVIIEEKYSKIYTFLNQQHSQQEQVKTNKETKIILLPGYPNYLRVFLKTSPFKWTAYQIIAQDQRSTSVIIPDELLPTTLQTWMTLHLSMPALVLILLPIIDDHLQREIRENSEEKIEWFRDYIRQQVQTVC